MQFGWIVELSLHLKRSNSPGQTKWGKHAEDTVSVPHLLPAARIGPSDLRPPLIMMITMMITIIILIIILIIIITIIIIIINNDDNNHNNGNDNNN